MTSDEQTQQEVSELIDPYHRRTSVHEDDKLFIEPGQVLDNIALAMERVDNDIDTSVSNEEDVAAADEIQSMIESKLLGPALAVHVVNTVMQIMSAANPPTLSPPLPPEYDLRKLLSRSRTKNTRSRTIFNNHPSLVGMTPFCQEVGVLTPLVRNQGLPQNRATRVRVLALIHGSGVAQWEERPLSFSDPSDVRPHSGVSGRSPPPLSRGCDTPPVLCGRLRAQGDGREADPRGLLVSMPWCTTTRSTLWALGHAAISARFRTERCA